jgi:uncharacterized protein (TIGR02118 family)
MMALLIAVYKTPKDKAAFDRHYHGTHAPLAMKIPGVKAYEISKGPVLPGTSNVHLVARLTFDSMAALQAGLGSPEGQATADDLANFASGGVELMMFDTVNLELARP